MRGWTGSHRSRSGIEDCETSRSRGGSGNGWCGSAQETSATSARSGVAFRSFGSRSVPGFAFISVVRAMRSWSCSAVETNTPSGATFDALSSIGRTTGAETMSSFRRWEDFLDERLQDPVRAVGYLNACLEDEDPEFFLLALRDVARARRAREARRSGLAEPRAPRPYAFRSRKPGASYCGNPPRRAGIPALDHAQGSELNPP